MSRDAKRIEQMAQSLYEVMPGAPSPGHIDLGDGLMVKAWGDVEHNEHYEFCRRIAQMIDHVDVRTQVNTD